jgi:hypothetical protein
MTRRWIVLFVLGFLFVLSQRVAAAEAQWIVVTAPAFRDAVGPLCEQRKDQGFRVVVVQTSDVLDAKQIRTGDAANLRGHVNKLCREFKGPSYVLLVGAVEAGKLAEPEKLVTPALRGTNSRMKGQPSDNGYGCPGEGLQPSVAVGRFPARTVKEAEQLVQKTLAYERDDRPGEWRRRLTVLAGIPAYNPFVDELVEGLAVARFDKLDPSWTGRAIYHNPLSRFCVPDALLHGRALDYVQAGQAFTLYLGHSNARGLYGGKARYLDRDDWAKLIIKRGAGVFATFGCNGCQLSGEDGEGYGLAAMRNPNGPVAVFGSHGICFAAMVQLASDGLFKSTFADKQPERLGAAWLGLKEGLARGKIDAVTYRLLDGVDGDRNTPQATQRQEHLEMFVLLGDPALRLALLPVDVKLRIDGDVAAGKTITVRGEAPARLAGAKVRLTVERPASSEPDDLELLPKEPGAKRERIMLANHERANRLVLVTKEVSVRDGRFEAKVELPAKLPYPRLLVRAYVATDKKEGVGVASLPLPAQE